MLNDPRELCASVDVEMTSSKAIEAVYPSDMMMSESKLARLVLNWGDSNIVNTNNSNIDYLMLFEPWHVRVNEKKKLLYFTDVSEGFIYVLDLKTRKVLKRMLVNGLPSYFDYFDDKFVLSTDKGIVQCIDENGKNLWMTNLSGSNGVCVGKENIYVSCKKSCRINVLNRESGEIVSVISERGREEGKLLFPHDLTLDNEENIIVCDSGNHRCQIFKKDGTHLCSFGKKGRENGCFQSPKGVIFDKKTNSIIVSDTMNNRIQIFDSKKRFVKSFKVKNDDLAFMRPVGLAISYELEEIYVSDFDYVRDVCTHNLLFVPIIKMPSSLEEFEKVIFCDDAIDFEKPTQTGLLLVCKAILKSVKSFKPNILNFTVFNMKVRCRFPLDAEYQKVVTKYKWIDVKPKDIPPKDIEWIDVFSNYLRRVKKLCNSNPFQKVEYVSFGPEMGKNYYTHFLCNFLETFGKFIKMVPNVKHYSINFNTFSKVHQFGQKLPPTTIVTMFYICEFCHQTSFFKPSNILWNQAIEFSEDSANAEELINAIPKNFQRNIEPVLFKYVIAQNFQDSQYIIDNCKIDIEYFSYIWNVHSLDLRQKLTAVNLHEIMGILQNIYIKYPTFRVFKIPIYDLECLKIIEKYPFVNINVGRNLTRSFLMSTIDKEDIITFCRDYNVDLSRLGKYEFSVASLIENCFDISKIKLDPNSRDKFGVTPCMLLYNPTNKPDITLRDNFGNNILHYYHFLHSSHSINTFKDMLLLTDLTDNEVKAMSEEPNIYGITPKEIAVSLFTGMNFENFSKIFNYQAFVRVCTDRPKLLFLDGLYVDMRILFSMINNLMPQHYNYEEFKDINYRDVNGKHFVHYCLDCFKDVIATRLEISIRDIVFCKDLNGTIPIQTSNIEYYHLLDKMASINDLPKFNFVSYANNFGMYRIMFLLVDNFFNNQKIVTECNSIAFDYINDQAQLISMCSHFSEGNYYFSIERSSLKHLRNVNYFGSVDGDDMSHYFVRFYYHLITSNPNLYVDYSILNALIRRGLKFDIVKNSEGKTAFDLIEDFSALASKKREVAELRKVCKRGLKTKSKSVSKFSIKFKNIPKENIIEETDNSLIISCDMVSQYLIRVHRSLYFEPKKRLTENVVNQKE